MLKGAEPIEIATLGASLLDLFLDNKKRGGPATSSDGGTIVKKGFVDLIERIVNELGWGVRDEGLFPLKLRGLDEEERKVIDDVIANHDKRVVDRLRIVTINVPNPPPTKVKGKKERKGKDGQVIEAGEPDKEIPSDVDNGVLFLKSLVPSLRSKSTEEQLKVLENFNLDGKSSLFAVQAMEVIKKKTAEALRFPEDATFEQVLARLQELVAQIQVPDPTQPRPNDKAGWFVRFMRLITPGSYPNR